MTSLTTQIGAKTVVVKCDAELRPQAEWLLGYLRETFGPDAGKLRDGFKLQVGWSILALREQNSELVIREPDYRGNPFQQWQDDISCTLSVQAQQNEVLELAEVEEGVPALFQDKVVLAKGCLAENRIYLHRLKDSPPGDSGWYIGPVTGGEQEPTYEAIYVYELLKRRPALLQALALPPGYMVIFDGNEIEGWRNEE